MRRNGRTLPACILGAVTHCWWACAAHAGTLFLGGDSFRLETPADALRVDDFDLDGRPDIAAVHPADQRISVLLGDPGSLLGAPAAYPAGIGAIDISSGDLDGDGYPDLVVANSGDSTVSVLINDRGGRFIARTAHPVGVGPRVVALADFNADGNLDAVTTNLISGDMDVLLGDGKAGFPVGSRVRVGDNPHDLALEDFDSDGAEDIAVAHSGAVTWFRGLADGSFARANVTRLSPDPRILTGGDLDADAVPDLAFIDDRGAVSCLRNEGAGTFAVSPVGQIPGFSFDVNRPTFLVAVDFDLDGTLDLVSEQTRILDSGLRVHPGLGGCSFGPPLDLFLDTAAADFAFADVDLDGLLDAVVTQRGAAGLAVYRGTGPGQLRARVVLPLEAAPRDLAAADLNGDGILDLVALASKGFQSIEVEPGGGFEPPRFHGLPGRALQNMVSADLDVDGRPELALTDVANRSLVTAFLDELGAVRTTSAYPVHDLPTRLAAGDFDADGLSDVAVLDQVSPVITLVLGAGKAGGGETRALPVSSGQLDLATGDVDRDGALDIAVATRADLRVLLGDGAGSFPRSTVLEKPANAPALALADGDGDGIAELFVVEGRKLLVLGEPAWPPWEEIELQEEGRVLRVHDMDLDGLPELFVAGSRSVLTILGPPGGRRRESYVVGASPRMIVFADLDSDQVEDAATADFGSQGLSILLGTTQGSGPPFRRGDTDGSGSPSLTDAIALLARLFLGGAALECEDAADANDDGTLNVTDAVSILLHLFAGGQPPAAPGPEVCGRDPTEDGLQPCEMGCTQP